MTVQDVSIQLPGATSPSLIFRDAYTPDGDFANLNVRNGIIAVSLQNTVNKWTDLNTLSDEVSRVADQLQAVNDSQAVIDQITNTNNYPNLKQLATVGIAGGIPAGQLFVPVGSPWIDFSTIQPLPSDLNNLAIGGLYLTPDGKVVTSNGPPFYNEYSNQPLYKASGGAANLSDLKGFAPTWEPLLQSQADSLSKVSQQKMTSLQTLQAFYDKWFEFTKSAISERKSLYQTLLGYF